MRSGTVQKDWLTGALGCRRRRQSAFTFIEVAFLVLVASLLLLTVLPALAKARSIDLTGVCLRNSRELVRAWTLYSADNQGRLCNNYALPETERAIATRQFGTWANNVMTWSTSGYAAQSTTNLQFLQASVLAPYTHDPETVVKCPNDIYLSAAQLRAGWTKRVRSVSMNGLLGRWDNTSSSSTGRSWSDEYRQFLKQTDIPNPANTWVTTEEHADTINDGFFLNAYDALQWGDTPASYHQGAGLFSFADGHSEVHPWRSTMPGVHSTAPTSAPFDAAGKLDFAWYRENTGFIPFR